MKFHHLARHSQLASNQQQQRDLSPTKQQRIQQQQASSQCQRQNLDLSDDEGDDFSGVQDYFDTNSPEQQVGNMQQTQASINNQQPIESGGFLMDKNKKLFPQKLWELIHNPSIQHCLRWSQDGQRVYLNRNEFEAYYLKTPNNQFHTQKAISFVRQMNMYGFRKVDDCYYENDNFRRDCQHLLKNMIRRHPNKGLFVGLDHHQLAAAAAAQQALQVNQQLQHLENQHKHRAEQALRLNSYLNNHHHQFNQNSLAQANHHNGQLKHHSVSQFEQTLSSQLVQAAANHLSQQHQQQQQQHNNNNHHHHLNKINHNSLVSGNTCVSGDKTSAQLSDFQQVVANSIYHQPKKSLLSDFYASATVNNTNNNNNNNNNNERNVNFATDANSSANQLLYNQDSLHSTSSVDTQPSQCNSEINSGSAGSPQPTSPNALNQRHHQQTSTSSMKASTMRSNKETGPIQALSNRFSHNRDAQFGTDLTSNSLAARQALHETLVRSLLQLKQQQPQDFLANLQHQNSRSLLESLASLSSVGTASIVDPTSNSPTERTATPPSCSSSPNHGNSSGKNNISQYIDNNNIALDLASKSTNFKVELSSADDDDEFGLEIEENAGDECPVESSAEDTEGIEASIGSPLDGVKKVERFLDDHVSQDNDLDDQVEVGIKRKIGIATDKLHIKRLKSLDQEDNGAKDMDDSNAGLISKSMIVNLCDRRGYRLDSEALNEASRYIECFLELLLEDASLISRHSFKKMPELDGEDGLVNGDDNELTPSKRSVDVSSLSLALKLIPTKLIVTLQQQDIK